MSVSRGSDCLTERRANHITIIEIGAKVPLYSFNAPRDTALRDIAMTAIVGRGDFTYRVQPNWARLPDRWDFADVGGVAVDPQDRVYVFNRGGHPMIVFNRAGSFVTSWGEAVFKRPHAVHLAMARSGAPMRVSTPRIAVRWRARCYRRSAHPQRRPRNSAAVPSIRPRRGR
jgi:hypothetical protein